MQKVKEQYGGHPVISFKGQARNIFTAESYKQF
jgi:hypothetical protein